MFPVRKIIKTNNSKSKTFMEARDMLRKMLEHETFTRGEMRDALVGISRGEYPVEQVTALLTGLQMRGVTEWPRLWPSARARACAS